MDLLNAFANDPPWDPNSYRWDHHRLVAEPVEDGKQVPRVAVKTGKSDQSSNSTLPVLERSDTGQPVSGWKGPLVCQVEGCGKNLAKDKRFFQRHRVCGEHLKASEILVSGRNCRFCQQCGRFHNLEEFDGDRRSCRRTLVAHNTRRKCRRGSRDSPERSKKRTVRTSQERGDLGSPAQGSRRQRTTLLPRTAYKDQDQWTSSPEGSSAELERPAAEERIRQQRPPPRRASSHLRATLERLDVDQGSGGHKKSNSFDDSAKIHVEGRDFLTEEDIDVKGAMKAWSELRRPRSARGRPSQEDRGTGGSPVGKRGEGTYQPGWRATVVSPSAEVDTGDAGGHGDELQAAEAGSSGASAQSEAMVPNILTAQPSPEQQPVCDIVGTCMATCGNVNMPGVALSDEELQLLTAQNVDQFVQDVVMECLGDGNLWFVGDDPIVDVDKDDDDLDVSLAGLSELSPCTAGVYGPHACVGDNFLETETRVVAGRREDMDQLVPCSYLASKAVLNDLTCMDDVSTHLSNNWQNRPTDMSKINVPLTGVTGGAGVFHHEMAAAEGMEGRQASCSWANTGQQGHGGFSYLPGRPGPPCCQEGQVPLPCWPSPTGPPGPPCGYDWTPGWPHPLAGGPLPSAAHARRFCSIPGNGNPELPMPLGGLYGGVYSTPGLGQETVLGHAGDDDDATLDLLLRDVWNTSIATGSNPGGDFYEVAKAALADELEYTPTVHHGGMSLKIGGIHPGQLPTTLADDLNEELMALGVYVHQGALRRGCVHLGLDWVFTGERGSGPVAGLPAVAPECLEEEASTHEVDMSSKVEGEIVNEVLDRTGAVLGRHGLTQGTTVVQIGSIMACYQNGRMTWLTRANKSVRVELLLLKPRVWVVGDQSQCIMVELACDDVQVEELQFFLRCRGRFHPVKLHQANWQPAVSESGKANRITSGVRENKGDSCRKEESEATVLIADLQIPDDWSMWGLAFLECQCRNVMSNSIPLLFVRDDAVAKELGHTFSLGGEVVNKVGGSMLHELGTLMDYLADGEDLDEVPEGEGSSGCGGQLATTGTGVTKEASVTCTTGCQSGCESGLEDEQTSGDEGEGTVSQVPDSELTEAHRIRDLHRTTLIASSLHLLPLLVQRGWAHTSTLVMEVLLKLGLPFRTVLEEVYRARSMCLMHLGIQSSNIEMVAQLLKWGAQYGVCWDWSRPGPRGLSPLQVAAVLEDKGALAAFLLRTVPEVPPFWFCQQGAMQSPAWLCCRNGNCGLVVLAKRMMRRANKDVGGASGEPGRTIASVGLLPTHPSAALHFSNTLEGTESSGVEHEDDRRVEKDVNVEQQRFWARATNAANPPCVPPAAGGEPNTRRSLEWSFDRRRGSGPSNLRRRSLAGPGVATDGRSENVRLSNEHAGRSSFMVERFLSEQPEISSGVPHSRTKGQQEAPLAEGVKEFQPGGVDPGASPTSPPADVILFPELWLLAQLAVRSWRGVRSLMLHTVASLVRNNWARVGRTADAVGPGQYGERTQCAGSEQDLSPASRFLCGYSVWSGFKDPQLEGEYRRFRSHSLKISDNLGSLLYLLFLASCVFQWVAHYHVSGIAGSAGMLMCVSVAVHAVPYLALLPSASAFKAYREPIMVISKLLGAILHSLACYASQSPAEPLTSISHLITKNLAVSMLLPLVKPLEPRYFLAYLFIHVVELTYRSSTGFTGLGKPLVVLASMVACCVLAWLFCAATDGWYRNHYLLTRDRVLQMNAWMAGRVLVMEGKGGLQLVRSQVGQQGKTSKVLHED